MALWCFCPERAKQTKIKNVENCCFILFFLVSCVKRWDLYRQIQRKYTQKKWQQPKSFLSDERIHYTGANQIFQQLVKYVHMYYRQTSKFQCFNLYIIWSAINANRRNCHTKQNIEIGNFQRHKTFKVATPTIQTRWNRYIVMYLCISVYVQWMEKKTRNWNYLAIKKAFVPKTQMKNAYKCYAVGFYYRVHFMVSLYCFSGLTWPLFALFCTHYHARTVLLFAQNLWSFTW